MNPLAWLYDRGVRPLLFRLDPETAHDATFALLSAVEHGLPIQWPAPAADPRLRQEIFGRSFPNPIGLAAGLDKNARLPHVWPALGFGFMELGTVTARSQPGNPPPRLFRLPADRALINRMGFNNIGAEEVAAALARRLRSGRPAVPIGINLGKSRAVAVDDALDDYRQSLRALLPHADYIAVNVSSPNTPGLRDLQDEARLRPLLQGLLATVSESPGAIERSTPLLLKVSPDLDEAAIEAAVRTALDCGVAGFIATNTTIARPPGLRSDAALCRESGGLSGAPLRDRATEAIRRVRRLCGPDTPIIGVGGIFSAADAYEKIRAGASLVQVYTSLIYEGPALLGRLQRGLAALLDRDGHSAIGAAVGSAAGPNGR